MEYIKLKNSDLVVSRICMGGCQMGGYGWGETSEANFLQAINDAIDNGVNFFDTADTYGLGQSEIILGKGLGERRNKVIIQSKFGVRVENGKTFYDNSPKYIEEALNNTLSRLGTNYIDIYVIHYRDGKTPLSDVVNKLLELKKEGKIRYFGISNLLEEDIEEYLKYKHLFVNCQNEFSLACRKHEKILNLASDMLNVTPMTWGSLGQGILTGKYNKDVCFGSNDRRSRDVYINFKGEKLLNNLKIVDYLREISQKYGKSIASCAIRFILDYLNDSVVLVGVKNSSQLFSNLEAIGWKLTSDEINILNNISLEGEKYE